MSNGYYSVPTFTAAATIQPNRFVELASSSGTTVQQVGTANNLPLGVSLPIAESVTATAAATAGNEVGVETRYGYAIDVELGGTVSVGALVESDNVGRAVAATATGTTLRAIAGVALQGGAIGEIVPVLFRPYVQRNAIV